MSAQAVIWDLDGVLADTMEAHFRSWVTALAQWEIPLDRDTFGSLFGFNNRDTLRALLGRPPEPLELGTISARKEHFFRILARESIHPFPGVRALLAELQTAGWLQAIASSAPQDNINLLVDRFGIREQFHIILSGEELPAGKPDPTIFLQAAQSLNLPPERCLVVEDAPMGIEAARRAGMRCMAVATTRPPEKLAAADLVVDSLNQVSAQTFADLLDTRVQDRH